MSKFICDVCGTSYPETATQCPICGCVRTADVEAVSGEGEAKAYTHVKGGRFSKANVRKRNRANAGAIQDIYYDTYEDEEQDSEEIVHEEVKSGKGLVVTAVILLLAIVAVVIYISLRFFAPQQPSGTLPQDTTTQADTSTATNVQIACQSITLDIPRIELDAVGAMRMLYAKVEPADTTDILEFTSSDEQVVTVTQSGKLIAVGPGEAEITVSCGNIIATCTVTCLFEEDPTDDTTEPTEDTTEPEGSFTFNRNTDFTLLYKGETWNLYTGTVPVGQITWSSDNENVATFENGIVTAVGEGNTQVHAEYAGQELSCKVICNFDSDASQGVGGSGNVSEDGGGSGAASGTCKIHSQYGLLSYGGVAEATISVGDVLYLSLVDSTGSAVSKSFVISGSCCSVSDNAVTGVSAGRATVTFTYNGVEYTCEIIVA